MSASSSMARLKGRSSAAALALAAAVMLVTANMLPVLETSNSGQDRSDTIFSGTVELWRQGLWAIAMLRWILIFLILAIVAAALDFTGIAGVSASIAKILFYIFLVLLLLSLIRQLIGGGGGRTGP